MTNFTPIFPLGIVAYPTEVVSLHIFEPRYIQLITECVEQQKTFALPVVIDGKVQETATMMQVKSIEKKYEGQEMDIRTIGLHICRILELIKELPDKLYSGAIVAHNAAPVFSMQNHQVQVIAKMRRLHQLLGVEKNYKKSDEELTSFDIAHHIGLNLHSEYELLCLENEGQRLTFLQMHMKEALDLLDEQQKTRDRILLNGHFRNLSLDNFDFKK